MQATSAGGSIPSRVAAALAGDGYILLKGFFPPGSLAGIADIALSANRRWIERNRTFYDTRAVNSAYLTSPRYCPDPADRKALFRFVGDGRLVELARAITGGEAFFGNTQLFFNPRHPERLPYWHRDIQYSGLPEEEQRRRIGIDVWLHFRVPLRDDPGLAFIPGSHRRWDEGDERDVRLEQAGRKSHEALPGEVVVPHGPGDLLIFSAHLLHKGVYGGDRHSLDILFGDSPVDRASVTAEGHFPDAAMLADLPNPEVFRIEGGTFS